MQNVLLDEVEYKITEGRSGTWRRFMYPTGALYAEYRSHATFFGFPLVHYTSGRNPETGRRVVARGVIAIGRLACGGLAIGQASVGVIGIGQATVGLLFALGQAGLGAVCVGQLAIGLALGIGQIATGSVAIGQFALGRLVLAQIGVGQAVWSPGRADPAAVDFFKGLFRLAS